MILNPNKTKAFVFLTNPPHGDLVLSGVSIRAIPNLDVIDVKFDSKLTVEAHHGIVSCVFHAENWYFEIDETYICDYFAFVLPISEYCYPVWGSADECHFQLRWPGFVLIRVSFHCVIVVVLLG